MTKKVIGAGIVIRDLTESGNEKILLGERADGLGLTIPAGKYDINGDSSIKETAMREAFEETGVDLTPFRSKIRLLTFGLSCYERIDKETRQIKEVPMAFSNIFIVDLFGDELKKLKPKTKTDGELTNIKFYSFKDIIQAVTEDNKKIFGPTMHTISAVFQNQISETIRKEIL